MLAEQRRRACGSSPASPTAGTAARPGRTAPSTGCSTSTIIPRATACGDANAAGTSLIGPHGMSAASSTAIHVGRRPAREPRTRGSGGGRRDARRGRRWSRTTRPRRGRAARSPRTGAATGARCRRRRRARRRPSRKVSYGMRFGCALPIRTGRRAAHERVLGLVDERRRASTRGATRRSAGRAMSVRGGASRASRPARIETAPNSPVTTSLIATPTLVGRPPSSSVAPVIDISPPTAWTTKS